VKYPGILHLIAFALAAVATPAPAQDDGIQTVHWAFSSFFGTGWYQVEDHRSVFVFRIPPRWTVRESSFDNGERELGIEVHFPATIGLHSLDFDDLPGNIDIDNFGTFSFTPGVELEIPINERWALRPFGKFGWGTEFELNETAWIWEAGIKSRYTIPTERAEWSLLSNIHWAGYDQDAGDDDDVISLLLGAEVRQPLRNTFRDHDVDLHWHATYTYLDREFRFQNSDGSYTLVDDIFEIGLAVSFRDRPFKFWLWKPDRLGLGVKFDPDGDFSAITFTSRSWFTK